MARVSSTIECDDRFIAVGGDWGAFAEPNGGGHLADGVLHRSWRHAKTWRTRGGSVSTYRRTGTSRQT